MTPEEVEARFLHIEALLVETAASQDRTDANLAKTEAIANSNAWREDASEIRLEGLEKCVSDLGKE